MRKRIRLRICHIEPEILHKMNIVLFGTVWSGHSRWLFSCSLYISCWTSACFTSTLLTCLTFLHTCPWPQLMIVPNSFSKGWWGAWLSAGFPGNRQANLMSIPPITSNLPLPSESKTAAMSCPAVYSTRWDVTPGPCFDTQAPPSIKPLMSLLLTPDSFFSLKAGQVSVLQACMVQLNRCISKIYIIKWPYCVDIQWFYI